MAPRRACEERDCVVENFLERLVLMRRRASRYPLRSRRRKPSRVVLNAFTAAVRTLDRFATTCGGLPLSTWTVCCPSRTITGRTCRCSTVKLSIPDPDRVALPHRLRRPTDPNAVEYRPV